ncbi:MAG: S16 family serine protease [Candidatus Micrarchaeota archaeon]
MKFSYVCLFTLLIVSLSTAISCNGIASNFAPSVVADNRTAIGELFNMSVRVSQGTGNIYFTIDPEVGLTTQFSALSAIRYAYSISNVSNQSCDTFVTLSRSEGVESVDGPSAGLNLAVLTYAALNNEPVRSDTVLTGAISKYGNALPVGGLFEKSKAAALSGAKYFAAPLDSLTTRIILLPIEKKYNIQIVNIKTAKEAIDFLVNGKLPQESSLFDATGVSPPDINASTVSGIENFKQLALNMVSLNNDSISNFKYSDKYANAIKSGFNLTIKKEELLLNKGYFFTAANDAFLNYIGLETINGYYSGDYVNIRETKKEINNCISSIPVIPKTLKNYEFVIGSELRKGWAEEKIQSTEPGILEEEKYFNYNDLMYAKAWCIVSSSIIDAVPVQNSPEQIYVNESLWQDLSKKRLDYVEKINSTNGEFKRRKTVAENLYNQGKYGASVFESQYLINYYALDYLSNDSLTNTNAVNTSTLFSYYTTSLWAKVYASHAEFIYQTSDDKNEAIKLLSYSKSLNDLNEALLDAQKINNSINSTGSSLQNNLQSPEDSLYKYLIFGVLFILIIIVLLYIQSRPKKQSEAPRYYKKK